MTQSTVALTGASGFLGRHIAVALQQQGWRVKALCRSDPITMTGVETVAGDLQDAAALDELLTGADAVVHAAGLIKSNDPSAYHAVNVAGTERLLECAGRRSPRAHVVHVSSLAAREPELSPYARSKFASEGTARRLVDPARLTVVRPPTLYGPHDRQTLAVFRSARLPLTPLLADGDERIALMDARDAALSIAELVALRTPGAFSLADDRPAGYTMREIFLEAARAQGKVPRFAKIPRSVFKAVGYGAGVFGRLTRRTPTLSPGKVAEMLHEDWSVDPTEMPAGLADKARNISDGFAQTVEWYRKAGWL